MGDLEGIQTNSRDIQVFGCVVRYVRCICDDYINSNAVRQEHSWDACVFAHTHWHHVSLAVASACSITDWVDALARRCLVCSEL